MAKMGCPAMETVAPTAQPKVKQLSVDRSHTFSMEKLKKSARATRE